MRNTLNASACAALLEAVNWGEPQLLLSLSILALINVMVIVGNCLVIAAVFCSSKLRSVTNLFIVSLAVADLLVGVAVLPFSATWEVFKVINTHKNTSNDPVSKPNVWTFFIQTTRIYHENHYHLFTVGCNRSDYRNNYFPILLNAPKNN